MRVTAEHRGLGNGSPDHAAGQNQSLGESGAHLRKVDSLDNIDVIDHAQSQTDDFFARHGNSRTNGNDNPNCWRRLVPAARCLPESARFRYDSVSPEFAAKRDHRASSTKALGLEISE